mmetsp:Transcript_17009/g.53458  ORF Transcript_17009/g.53458 Transcript_17009/m.53458 type:complete len:238 (-) Transcript_17009:319-1032(-)
MEQASRLRAQPWQPSTHGKDEGNTQEGRDGDHDGLVGSHGPRSARQVQLLAPDHLAVAEAVRPQHAARPQPSALDVAACVGGAVGPEDHAAIRHGCFPWRLGVPELRAVLKMQAEHAARVVHEQHGLVAGVERHEVPDPRADADLPELLAALRLDGDDAGVAAVLIGPVESGEDQALIGLDVARVVALGLRVLPLPHLPAGAHVQREEEAVVAAGEEQPVHEGGVVVGERPVQLVLP